MLVYTKHRHLALHGILAVIWSEYSAQNVLPLPNNPTVGDVICTPLRCVHVLSCKP